MILQSDQCSHLCRCAPGYYGSPTQPGGMCRKCNCGGNIDPLVPGSCDSVTGACNICANNTEGEYCERCRPGYFGSARNGDCRRECKFVVTDVIFDWNAEGEKINKKCSKCACMVLILSFCMCVFTTSLPSVRKLANVPKCWSNSITDNVTEFLLSLILKVTTVSNCLDNAVIDYVTVYNVSVYVSCKELSSWYI